MTCEAAKKLGKSGGLKKSEKKTAACRKNASKPRARWVTATYYEIEYKGENGKRGIKDGLILQKGIVDTCLVDNHEEVISLLEQHSGQKIVYLRKFESTARKI